MPDYSSHQKKIIDRYYDQRDAIMLTKLQELATELYLADGKKQQDRLWERARKAMVNLKVPAKRMDHLLEKRDPALLAGSVQEWLKESQK